MAEGASHARSRHTRAVVAGVLAAAVPFLAGVVLMARHAASGEPGVFEFWRESLLNTMTFAVVGALIRLRRPGNRVGALFAVIAVLGALQTLSGEYEAYAAHVAPGLPAGEQAGRVSGVAQVGFVCGYLLLLQIFPDGQLLGRRWRLLTACTAVAVLVGFVGALTDLAVDGRAWQILLQVALSVAGLGSFAAIVVRWRRADGRVRAQLKWVAFAAVATLALIVSGALGAWSWPVAGILVPVATVVAILRYRLYDIDRIVSRTASYALLTGGLALVYAGLVTLAGRLLPSRSNVAVALATLAVAALFQPARRRVQAGVDRRFNRARYDAARTIDGFSARLREQVHLDALTADLLTVVQDTMQPASAGLWLRSPGGSQR